MNIHFIWTEEIHSGFLKIAMNESIFQDLFCIDGCVFLSPIGGSNIFVGGSSFVSIFAVREGAVIFNNYCKVYN